MNKHIVHIIFFVLIYGFSKTFAFDLVKAYENTLIYNSNYLSSIANNKASQEEKAQAMSALLPQVSATGTIGETHMAIANSAKFYYHQTTTSMQLEQVIFDFSKFSAYTKSKYSVQVANLQLLNAKQQLISTVAEAYFDVLYAFDIHNAVISAKNVFEKQLTQSQKSFDAGLVNITDVNDVKYGYADAVAQELQAQNDLRDKKNIFNKLTGLNSDEISEVVKDINLNKPIPNSVESWVDIANKNNLDIQIARLQLEMADKDISIARSGHLPKLSANLSYKYQGDLRVDGVDSPQTQAIIDMSSNVPGGFLASYNQATATLQVDFPIYSGGSVSSKVRQAKSNYEASKQQLVSIERQVAQKIKNAYLQVETGFEFVKAQTQALKSADLKLESDRKGYKEGIRNSIDLVSSEKNYITALQNYNKARYQYLLNQLQLKYLSGEIDIDFLKKINENITKLRSSKQSSVTPRQPHA